MERSHRREEISRLNVLFCLLVIFIHVLSQAVSSLDRMSWQYALVAVPQRLSFVAVYGFFFLSGVKLTLPRSRPQTLGAYYLSRVKSILLPYLVAAAAYYAFYIVIGWYTFDWKAFLGQTALGTLVSPFYFVVALTQFILLTPVFRAAAKRYSPVITLPLSLGITWLSAVYLPSILQLFAPELAFPYADRVLTTYLIYYLAGCYAGANYQDFLDLLEKNRPLLIPTALFFMLVNAVLTWLNASGRRWIPYLEFIHTLYLLSAILALYGWSARRGPFRRKGLGRLLPHIDRASYLIYLYHSLVITVFNSFSARLGATRVAALLVLRALVVFPVSIGGCILWQKAWSALKKKLPPPVGPAATREKQP